MVREEGVPKGYKKTEVGVIPEDWEVKRLGEILMLLRTGTNSRSELTDEGNIGYIHYGDIHSKWDTVLDCSIAQVPYIEEKKARNLPRLRDGDLVMADASEDYAGLGKSVEIANIGEQEIVAGLHTILLRGNKELVADGFKGFLQFMQPVRESLCSIATGISVYGISKRNLKDISIPLPLLPEQKAIAEVLSDVDELIASIDKLIAKKRDIKQAGMQQLLTGKKRLPGFDGEWRKCQLSDVGVFAKGKGIKKDDLIPYGISCIRYGEIYTHHNDYIREFYSFISEEVASECRSIVKGDLLFAGSGETAEEIGKCVAFLGEEEAYAGGDIVVFTPFNEDSMYLGYLMNYESITCQKARMAQGDAVVHISATNLGQLQLSLPQRDEQAAIASVLSDMDAEIKAFERRLEKIRLIKEGMMEELLTGKVRLV
jgi:type I restriction enzyme S subunit